MSHTKARPWYMGRLTLSLSFFLFASGRVAYCEKPTVKVFSGKGCSIAIDDTWEVSSDTQNTGFLKQAEELAATNDPEVHARIDAATVLFSAIKEKKHLRTISLLTMPAEASQKEMSAWDAEFCKALQSALKKATRPAQEKLGFKNVVYAEPKIEVINGVRCFVLKFDYVDSNRTPSVTERRDFILPAGLLSLR